MIMSIRWYILVAICYKSNAVLKPQENVIEIESVKYAEALKECNLLPSGNCLYTSDKLYPAQDIMNKYIFSQKMCTSLISQLDQYGGNDTAHAHDMFVFIEKIENLIEKIKEIINYGLCAAQTRVHFILWQQVGKHILLANTLQTIWNLKIYNFVVVIVQKRFEVYSFNNFLSKRMSLVAMSENFCKNLFPDKVKDLEAAEVRVGLFEKLPVVYWDEKSESFKGADTDIMKLFARITNSTLKIFYKPEGYAAIDSLHKNETDIIFVGILQVSAFPGLDYSYPIDRDDRVIVILKPSKVPVFQNIVHIFEKSTWLLLLFSFIFLPVLFIWAEKVRNFQICLDHYQNIWALSLNVASNTFLSSKNGLKFLMLFWVWASLIITAGFQTSLFGRILKATYEKDIDSIKDLKSSGMKIYLHEFHALHENFNTTGFSLKDQYVYTNVSENNEMLLNKEGDAHIVSYDVATMIINQFIYNLSDPVYKIVPEVFIPGLRVFHLQKNSPFTEKLNEILLVLEQYGLWRKKKYSISMEQYQESKKLNLSHLGFAFIMHLYGNILAFVVFVCEVVWSKIKIYLHWKFSAV